MVRAALLALFLLFLPAAEAQAAEVSARGWQALRENGRVALVHHARAPGTCDPKGYTLDDCKTQRNLNDEGRKQALKLGDRIPRREHQRHQGSHVAMVPLPPDRGVEDLGPIEEAPIFNNAHMLSHNRDELAASGRKVIAAWEGPGILLVSTHGANVLAMLGIHPREGEVVVVEPEPSGEDKIRIVARIPPSS